MKRTQKAQSKKLLQLASDQAAKSAQVKTPQQDGLEQFEFLQIVGRGAFGHVYQVSKLTF